MLVLHRKQGLAAFSTKQTALVVVDDDEEDDVVFVTRTPLQNKLSDLWALMDFVLPIDMLLAESSSALSAMALT